MKKGCPHMNLTDERLRELENPTLTRNQRASLRCHLAAEFIHTGQYELAQQALGELWQGIGERPLLKGLSTSTQAEVLLQCGSLMGWLGSARQIPDARLAVVEERVSQSIEQALDAQTIADTLPEGAPFSAEILAG